MANTKRPEYFPFYVMDFLGDQDTQLMDAEEVGAYWLLLCHAWMSTPVCTIPNDEQALARLARVSLEGWSRVAKAVLKPWHSDPENEGRLKQKRLYQTWCDLNKKMAQARENGRKGGKARAENTPDDTKNEDFTLSSDGQGSLKGRSSEGKATLKLLKGKGKGNIYPPNPPEGGSPKQSAKSRIALDMTTYKWEGITDEDLTGWAEAYPALNLQVELAKMAQWVKANPKNKKKQWRRFITQWLSRSQDRAPRVNQNGNGQQTHRVHSRDSAIYNQRIDGLPTGRM